MEWYHIPRETKCCTELNVNWNQRISYSMHADKGISLTPVLERTEVFSPGIFSQDRSLFVWFDFILFSCQIHFFQFSLSSCFCKFSMFKPFIRKKVVSQTSVASYTNWFTNQCTFCVNCLGIFQLGLAWKKKVEVIKTGLGKWNER